jgi:hypothetical protein
MVYIIGHGNNVVYMWQRKKPLRARGSVPAIGAWARAISLICSHGVVPLVRRKGHTSGAAGGTHWKVCLVDEDGCRNITIGLGSSIAAVEGEVGEY